MVDGMMALLSVAPSVHDSSIAKSWTCAVASGGVGQRPAESGGSGQQHPATSGESGQQHPATSGRSEQRAAVSGGCRQQPTMHGGSCQQAAVSGWAAQQPAESGWSGQLSAPSRGPGRQAACGGSGQPAEVFGRPGQQPIASGWSGQPSAPRGGPGGPGQQAAVPGWSVHQAAAPGSAAHEASVPGGSGQQAAVPDWSGQQQPTVSGTAAQQAAACGGTGPQPALPGWSEQLPAPRGGSGGPGQQAASSGPRQPAVSGRAAQQPGAFGWSGQQPTASGGSRQLAAVPCRPAALALGLECDLRYWDSELDLWQTFPFQKDAVECAYWCNVAPPAVVRELQRQSARINFTSFAARSGFTKNWMEQHPVAKGEPVSRDVVKVFTQEYQSRSGDYSRHFIATTYNVLWRRYQLLKPGRRHFYEVIQADRACHLYFDLEYQEDCNPQADGPALVERLVRLVQRCFRETWGFDVGTQCFLELESITNTPAPAGAGASDTHCIDNNHLASSGGTHAPAAATGSVCHAADPSAHGGGDPVGQNSSAACAADRALVSVANDAGQTVLDGTSGAYVGSSRVLSAAAGEADRVACVATHWTPPGQDGVLNDWPRDPARNSGGSSSGGASGGGSSSCGGASGGSGRSSGGSNTCHGVSVVGTSLAGISRAGVVGIPPSSCHLPTGGDCAGGSDDRRGGAHTVNTSTHNCSGGGSGGGGNGGDVGGVAGSGGGQTGPPGKFSRHLVVRIPGRAFKNNLVVGSFVSRLQQYRELEALTVHKDTSSGAHVSLVDTTVYSKNRHFRIAWSCKGGKTATLRPTNRFMMAAAGAHINAAPQPRVFLASLICNVHPDAALLTIPADKAVFQQVVPFNSAGPGGAGGQVFVNVGLGRSSSASQFVCDGHVTHPTTGRSIKMMWTYLAGEHVPPALSNPARAVLQSIATAAMPFVEVVATEAAGGLETLVRSVAYCGDAACVAFGMIGPGSHHCGRIGRCHKSNHVFFLLDFTAGLIAQKCYDPECAGYRSAWLPVPREVWKPDALKGLDPVPPPASDQGHSGAAAAAGRPSHTSLAVPLR